MDMEEEFTFIGDDEGLTFMPYYQAQIEIRTIEYIDYMGFQFPAITQDIFGLVELSGARITVSILNQQVPEPAAAWLALAGFSMLGLCRLPRRAN